MKYIEHAVFGVVLILAFLAIERWYPEASTVPPDSWEMQTPVQTNTAPRTQTPVSPEPVVEEKPAGTGLTLSGQGLTRVPEYVFSRTDITFLDVSNNKLTGALQAEVRKLTKLRSLDLSDNDFTGVPAEVGQLSQLEVLNLSNNPITGLPYEIGNLKNLKTLDLRGTQYSTQDLEVIRKTLPATAAILTD